MSTNTTTTNDTLAGIIMIPFFHFAGGDHLFFKAWQPASGGAIGGACIGLFFVAMFERWFHAISPALIHYLVQRKSQSTITIKEKRLLPPRKTPPFIVSIDVPRGMIYAFQRLLGFALMLAVMTFHAGYILSVIFGLTCGEILFGRVAYGVVKDDR